MLVSFALRRAVRVTTAAALFLTVAWTQEQPGGGGNTGGGAGAGAGAGPSPTPNVPGPGTGGNVPGFPGTGGQQPGRPGRIPGMDQQFPEFQRPIFISGRVMLQDGTAPTEQVIIERVCGGQVYPEGYTDSKGRFSFEVGRNNLTMMDASTSSMGNVGGMGGGMGGMGGGMPGMPGRQRGITERDIQMCELRAALPGHRSQIVQLAGRRVMDNPDVGTILLRRLGAVEGLTVSATRALAPKDARKAYEKGMGAARKQKWEEATTHFQKALDTYPKFADAWVNLGLVREQQKDVEGARKAWSEALAADAKLIPPYLHLARTAASEEKWQDVADTTDRAIKLNPYDYPRAYLLNAVAHLNLKQLDDAERSAREGLKQDEQHSMPQLEHVLGIVLAQKQDYAGAAEHMKAFLQQAPNTPTAETVRKQLAEVERVMQAKQQ